MRDILTHSDAAAVRPGEELAVNALAYYLSVSRREHMTWLGSIACSGRSIPIFSEAPEVFLLCEDPAVIAGPFFLMERRRGVVIRDSVPPELAGIPDYPRLVSEAFISDERFRAFDGRVRALVRVATSLMEKRS